MDFPENLQRIRNLKNISQEQLAEIMNVSRQSVAKWESGKSYPDIKRLIELSDLFNVSIDELIKDNGKNNCKFSQSDLNGGFIMDEKIIKFLCKAKKSTYACKDAKECMPCRNKSHDFEYIEGDLRYLDSYVGSHNFCGEEVVWKDDVPMWSMNYAGRVLNENFCGDFLKESLSNVPEEYPYRGPLEYRKERFLYKCKVDGNINWFNGQEEIYKDNIKVYECNFHGGTLG